MKSIISFFTAIMFFGAGTVLAIDQLELVDGTSYVIAISRKDANLIKFNSNAIRAFTTSKLVNVKIDGPNAFVTVTDYIPGPDIDMKAVIASEGPQQVFFAIDDITFSALFVIKDIPGQMIVAKSTEQDLVKAAKWERERDYVGGAVEVLQAMLTEIPPSGYAISKQKKGLKSPIEGTALFLTEIYKGATLTGEIYDIINGSLDTIFFQEADFYEPGIIAVSVKKTALEKGEKAQLYIVRMENKKDEGGNYMDFLSSRGIKK